MVAASAPAWSCIDVASGAIRYVTIWPPLLARTYHPSPRARRRMTGIGFSAPLEKTVTTLRPGSPQEIAPWGDPASHEPTLAPARTPGPPQEIRRSRDDDVPIARGRREGVGRRRI